MMSSASPFIIDLWTVDLDEWSSAGLDPSTVTDLDRSQADRLRSPESGRRLLARRSATRTILAWVLDVPVGDLDIQRSCPVCGSTDHGRSHLTAVPFAFSVSASDALAVVAVSDGQVGVDLEVVDENATPLEAALTAHERRRMATLAREDRETGFLRLWTAKEAVLKAGGRSLADDPATVEVGDALDGDLTAAVDGDRTWTVQHLSVAHPSGHPAVVAVADTAGGPVAWHSITR
jgi:4'-phosphopantetheinyl transferase